MLEAFLSFNSAFKVVWAGSAMQQYHREVLREVFPEWEGSFSRMPYRSEIVRALHRRQQCLALQLLDHSNQLARSLITHSRKSSETPTFLAELGRYAALKALIDLNGTRLQRELC